MHTKVLGATPERLKYFKVKYTSNALHALTRALFLLRPNFIIRCTRHAISQEAFESQVGSTIFNDGNTYSHRLLLPGMLYTVAPVVQLVTSKPSDVSSSLGAVTRTGIFPHKKMKKIG